MATAKKTTEATPENKLYKFRSEYKALTVSSLGIQFVDGIATTDDVSVARALATIDGVTLIEK